MLGGNGMPIRSDFTASFGPWYASGYWKSSYNVFICSVSRSMTSLPRVLYPEDSRTSARTGGS
jgi:hypothetical protein